MGIVAAALGMAETEVAETVTSDGGVKALEDKFDAKFKAQRDQGDQRATKKTRTAVEKALKTAGLPDFVFDPDQSFDDNVASAVAELQSKAVGTGSEGKLTAEQVLKHPDVVKALNALKTEKEQAIEQARAQEREALNGKIQEFTKQQTDAKVRAKAAALVDELKPNFTPGKEAAQRKKLIDDLVAQGGYKLSDTGDDVLLVDADGNLLDGSMGNTAKFADRVRGYADELYGLPTATERQSPGVEQKDLAGGNSRFKHFKGETPKTKAEALKLADDDKLPLEAREELLAYSKEAD